MKESRARQRSLRVIYRQRRKEKIVAYKGGKCQSCGYNKCIAALSLHHRNPAEKEFNFAHSNMLRPWERVKAEANKCDLLCMNCHAEEHWGVAQR